MDEENELLAIKKRLEQQVAINLFQEQELRIARRNITKQLWGPRFSLQFHINDLLTKELTN